LLPAFCPPGIFYCLPVRSGGRRMLALAASIPTFIVGTFVLNIPAQQAGKGSWLSLCS